ncbi:MULTISPECIES: hypothetical protein [Micromonospora]|uniref:Glycosyl transferase n=1 Tax=Micromonospora profundi TaxID=1420889 RepID=A0AAJ6HS61_9ACTN|nr:MULTISPECIES: hypothetical protein [Micromonospora]NJC14626.1 hypothetical protein [Micromonospora profundi]WLS46175.1 hypothetical protein Q3V37_02485 [Micromonospora profundi]
MSSAAPTAPDAAPDQAVRLADQVNRRTRAVRLLAAVRRHRADLLVALLWVVLAGWLTHGLWPDPGGRTLALNPEDQALYEWFLAVDARALLGDFSLLTDRLNAPDGVNLMANTTVIALGIVCAPITLLLGAPVTFALLAAANLAGTALAWYLLFHRTMRTRRLAAALGGGLCGFGPGMVSQTNSHLHMTAQWLVPVIVWLVVRLLRASDPGRTPAGSTRALPSGPDRRRMISSAVGLAAAVTAQVFIGEEVLFLAAVTLLVMAISYAVADRDLARRALPGFAGGLAIAAGLALMVLGYPLWFQFAGPQGVADGMFSPSYFSADLSSWWAISPLSIAGSDQASRLTTGPAEYNTFLGWPLLLVTAACAIWTGRRRLVFTCVVAGLVMGALSLGPEVVLGGIRTAVPGPYALLAGLPVVDGALPMRFGLALLPIVATLLVLAVDRALRSTGRARRLVPLAVAAALLPIFPTPLPTAARPEVPEFITGGHWKQCVRPGGVLVPVPLPTPKEPWPMRWAVAANAGFGMPEGFFIGPYGRGGTAAMGTFKQPTSALLADVARRGDLPAIGDEQRRQAARDADFWGASCVALADDAPHADSLRATLEQLYGPANRIADAWTWRV